jgi:hypothetical protein
MPGGMIMCDPKNSFAAAIFMGATQKMIFGSDNEPDIAKDGQRKYSSDVAVTYLAEGGRKPFSEVLSVSTMGTDPSATITPGQPVEFDRLRVGVSAASRNERGGVSGGRMYFMADAIRPSAPANGRTLASAAAKSEG